MRSMTRRSRFGAGALTTAALAAAVVPSLAHSATITAVSNEPGRITIVQRNPTSGTLEQSVYTESGKLWSSWSDIGDTVPAGTDLSLVSRSSTTMDLFYRDSAGTFRRKSWSASNGQWTAGVSLATTAFVNGPAAVATNASGTVQLLGRNAADGTLLRLTWNAAANTTTAAYSNLTVSTGTLPGGSTTNGSLVQAVIAGNDGAANTQPYFVSLDTAGTVPWDLYAARVALPSKILGSPAVTSQSTGATTITARNASGQLVKLARTSTTAAWPATWTTLASPPANGSTTASPITLTYKPTSTGTEVVKTIVPTTDAQGFLVSDSGSGWSTVVPTPPRLSTAPSAPGAIRYYGRTGYTPTQSDFDTYVGVANGTGAQATTARKFFNEKFYRLHVSSPFFNGGTAWYAGGMAYQQLYTVPSAALAANPTWNLTDGAGNTLYADDGQIPRQLTAGNIFDPAFRKYMIDQFQSVLTVPSANKYRGLWLDNVNQNVSESGLSGQYGQKIGNLGGTNVPFYARSGKDCNGNTIPSTGLAMSDACWASTIATFVEEVKVRMDSLGKELLTNTPWMQPQRDPTTYNTIQVAGNPGYVQGGLATSASQRVAAASTTVNVEGGFWGADASGLGPNGSFTGNSSELYSLDMKFRLVDGIHNAGRNAVIDYVEAEQNTGNATDDDNARRRREFELAGYLLTSNGADGIGEYDRRGPLAISGNVKTTNWPNVTGVNGSVTNGLFDLDIGTAVPLPAGVTSSGIGANSRGVVSVAQSTGSVYNYRGSRMWVRKFVRADGKSVWVILNEKNWPWQAAAVDTWTIPGVSGCTNLTRPTGAQPTYATVASNGALSIGNQAALIVACN